MSGSTGGTADVRYDSDFSRIAELIKGNNFSREEISRLVEILNSRVDNAREKQKSIIGAEGHSPLVTWTHESQRTPPQEKRQAIDRTMIGTEQLISDVSPEVGASPIDIARAYMASRTSGGLDHDNLLSKCERAQPSNEFTQKQLLPSPSPKPSICWPGAMVPDPHGYATPQSQKGKPKLHDFRRTPYSRTTLSKSATKVQAEIGYPYTSTPFQPSQPPVYDWVKTRGHNVDGYGSVGPIRRIRNKFASEVRPRGSVFRSSSTGLPSINVTPKDFGGFLPNTVRDLEPGETSGASKQWSGGNVPSPSDKGVSNPHLSSSQAVKKILEHLDRNKPTPKEKEAELKLVTSWRKSSIEVTDTGHKEITNSLHIGELASHKNMDAAAQNIPEEINKISNSKFSLNYHDKGTDEANNAINGNATASSSVSTGFNMSSGGNFLPSFGNIGTSGPAVKNLNKGFFATTTNHGQQSQTNLQFSRPQAGDGQVLTMVAASTGSELSKDNANKPSLASISVKRPDFRAARFDNGPGFTFPVSASSGVLSELPTPSIIPPSSASFLSQPVAGVPAELPSYSFGTNKSSPRLVFSFPSTSSAPANVDSDMKFSFGSEKTTERLSFSSFGKDAICY